MPLSNDAPDGWRALTLTTRVAPRGEGAVRLWIPRPGMVHTTWQRPLGGSVTVEGGTTTRVSDPEAALDLVFVEGGPGLVVTVVDHLAVRDHAVAPGRAPAPPVDASTRARALAPTRLLPLDGIVADTAREVTRGATSDVEKARAIYHWIVERTLRDPGTRGCGTGDIRAMLETGALRGKCADLNALFVGLARAAGLPAREWFGLRVGPSPHGHQSLGVGSPVVSKAQHCRAEVLLDGVGWLPVDPADVRKLALEEPPGGRALDDPEVAAVRGRLFGAWDMNWIAYNHAHDVVLLGARRGPLPFFMYPQAETAAGWLDPYDPDAFGYSIAVSSG